MGKASSSKKVARAARAAGRPGARRNYTWPAVISIVVVLGVLGVVLSRGGSESASAGPPTLQDHWHEAYGFYLCGKWAPVLPQQLHSGIHTHADGLIHVEPLTHQETGKNANVGKFVKDFGNGLVVTQSEIRLPGSSKAYKDGGKCGAKKASVKIWFWKNVTDKKPKLLTGSLSDMHIEENSAIAFSYLPDGRVPPLPPSVAALQNPNANEGNTGGTPSSVTLPQSPPSSVATTPSSESTAPPESSSSSSPSSTP